MKNNDILKEFDETWGWAPKESPKYKKGKMVKAFISKALEERDREWEAKIYELSRHGDFLLSIQNEDNHNKAVVKLLNGFINILHSKE